MTFTLLVADLVTGDVVDEVRADSVRFGETLCAPGGWSARLLPGSARAQSELLAPGGAVLHVLDDASEHLFAGIVWAADWDGDSLTVGGEGLWSYFRQTSGRDRVYRGGTGGMTWAAPAFGGAYWTAVDQHRIVADLVGWAQAEPYGDLGVTVRGHPAVSGVPRDLIMVVTDRKSIGEQVEDLAGLADGFEFRCVCEWDGGRLRRYLDLWYPRCGTQTDVVWEHGYQVRVSRFPRRVGANRVDVLGQDQATVGTAANIPAGTLRHDMVVSRTDLGDAGMLAATAAGELARVTSGVDTLSVDILDLDLYALGSFQVGEQVRVVADDGALQLDGSRWWRIIGWMATVERGTASVSVDLAAGESTGRPLLLPADERARAARDQSRRVERLERRPVSTAGAGVDFDGFAS